MHLLEFFGIMIGFLCISSILLGLILSFRKSQKELQIGKSMGCIAILTLNWFTIYIITFDLPGIFNVWRWLPGLIFGSILIICLLIIWKPFSNKVVLAISLALIVGMATLTTAIIINWSNFDSLPAFNPYITGRDWHREVPLDFAAQFGRIMHYRWQAHVGSSVIGLMMYMGFRKNKVAAGIGRVTLCAFILFVVGGLFVEMVR